jgi:DNA-binding NtrC family response regulator
MVPDVSRAHTVMTTQGTPGDVGGSVRAQLVVVEGPDRGRAVALEEDVVVVGTDAACALRLTDETVSARHLEIRRDGAAFHVRDLGSTNGTLHQGSRLVEAHLTAGSTVKLGHTFLVMGWIPRPLDVVPSQSRRFGGMVAESLAMREVFAVLELAAQSDVTVLLEGETGTGKELAARALHDHSERRKGPFVAVDCSALPEGLMESELFGHVKGAFTGAVAARRGALVRAHGGTLFLDELGTVPLTVQARLLRVLEERVVRPTGGDEERAVDVRVVAASQVDLNQRVAEGAFRADLFYRLAVLQVTLPPLRSRREDIPRMVAEMLKQRGVDVPPGTALKLDALMAHMWPGNVRELRNAVDRALALAPGATTAAQLRLRPSETTAEAPAPVRSDLPFKDAKELTVHNFEARYLADLMARCHGNISQAAREAQLDRKNLKALLRRHGTMVLDDDPA